MAVMTTIAIIAGVTLLVGGLATGAAYYATESDRAKAEVARIDNEIQNCETIINYYMGIKTNLNTAYSYLNLGKSKFTSGGHVLDGQPLASAEFSSCMEKLTAAVQNVNNIISGYESDKAQLRRERAKEAAKIK